MRTNFDDLNRAHEAVLKLAEEHERLDAQVQRLDERKRALIGEERELRRAIADNGGSTKPLAAAPTTRRALGWNCSSA